MVLTAQQQALQLAKRKRIFTTLSSLHLLPGIDVTEDDNYRTIYVAATHQHVPDFAFQWSDDYGYFRGYVYVVNTRLGYAKSNAGYAICTLKNSFTAALFITVYQFFVKNRAFQLV